MRKQNDPIIIARNAMIAKCFYYLHTVKRIRYDDVMEKLSKELFYLSIQRLGKILRMPEQCKVLQEIKDKLTKAPDLITNLEAVEKLGR